MRLLLAEDEKTLSRALVTILEHNNYSVDAVYDGQDALDYLINGNYDGAILDIMMPKLDGVSVLRQIRSSGSSLPVLLLTAKAEIDDRVLGLDSGADDYLPKPFDVKELLARLRAMLRRRSETVDTVLRLPIAEWEQEYADLKTQRDSDYAKLKDTRADVSELQKIRKCVDIALRADQPEQTQTRTKRHDIDR